MFDLFVIFRISHQRAHSDESRPGKSLNLTSPEHRRHFATNPGDVSPRLLCQNVDYCSKNVDFCSKNVDIPVGDGSCSLAKSPPVQISSQIQSSPVTSRRKCTAGISEQKTQKSVPSAVARIGSRYFQNKNSSRNNSRESSASRGVAAVRDVSCRRSSARIGSASRDASAAMEGKYKQEKSAFERNHPKKYLSLPRSAKLGSRRVNSEEHVSPPSVLDSKGTRSQEDILSSADDPVFKMPNFVSKGMASRQDAQTPAGRFSQMGTENRTNENRSKENRISSVYGGSSLPMQSYISQRQSGNAGRKSLEGLLDIVATSSPNHFDDENNATFSSKVSFDSGISSQHLKSEKCMKRTLSNDSIKLVKNIDNVDARPLLCSTQPNLMEPVVPGQCSLACKKFLNVPNADSCLCHLLRKVSLADEFDQSFVTNEFSSTMCETNPFKKVESCADEKMDQRINAIEETLRTIKSQVSTEQNARKSDSIFQEIMPDDGKMSILSFIDSCHQKFCGPVDFTDADQHNKEMLKKRLSSSILEMQNKEAKDDSNLLRKSDTFSRVGRFSLDNNPSVISENNIRPSEFLDNIKRKDFVRPEPDSSDSQSSSPVQKFSLARKPSLPASLVNISSKKQSSSYHKHCGSNSANSGAQKTPRNPAIFRP